jgi:hypothetical protein
MPGIDPNDTAHYMDQAMALVSTDPVLLRANKALSLFSAGLFMVPAIEWQAVYPNDFAALACLARAFRQLRAAHMLMVGGYLAEVRVLLRAVYESSGLARMLAHDETRAEKWLRQQHWFPDREVREWFATSVPNSTGSQPDEILDRYKTGYRAMSDRSHPTAIACVSALRAEENGPVVQLETTFDEEEFRTCAAEIAATAMFACFALRNAAVDESVLPPQWRQDVYELAREIIGSDMPHLDRDWAEEQQKFDRLQNRIQSAKNLAENLRRDPRSWWNLREPN